MPMYWKRKILAAKSEGTYGTDATPAVGTEAILARNIKISPLEQEYEERGNELNYVGHQGDLVAGSYVKIDFEVEIAGGGAAGNASPDGALIKACGASETLNAGVSSVYVPVAPSAATSCSIYFWMGGRRHKIVGAYGNVEFEWVKGRVPLKKYSFIGLYTIPDDNALSAPTLTAFQKPLTVTNVNTPTHTLFTFAGKFKEIRFSTGNELNYRNMVGSEAVRFTDRKSTGKVVLEDELVATKDWWTIIKAGTLGALALTHGTAAGNIVALAAANVQLKNPSMDADQNIAMLSLDMNLLPSSSGNDEWSITMT